MNSDMGNRSDEQTDDPAYADERDFYKVEAWSRDDELMVMMLFAGSSFDRAHEIFEAEVKRRPNIRLTMATQSGPSEVARRKCALAGPMVKFLSNRPEQPTPLRIENASLPAHDATEGLRNLAGKPRPAHHPGRGLSLRTHLVVVGLAR
jgi:hypothetical protein